MITLRNLLLPYFENLCIILLIFPILVGRKHETSSQEKNLNQLFIHFISIFDIIASTVILFPEMETDKMESYKMQKVEVIRKLVKTYYQRLQKQIIILMRIHILLFIFLDFYY